MGDSGAQSSQPASGAPSSGGAGWRQWVKSAALLLVAAVSLYLLLPTLLSVFGSWRSLSHLEWYFAVPVFASEGVSAVHSGDAAQGRGRHRRGGGGLLGVDRPAARDHGGTALLALPAIIGGTPVSHSLVAAAYLGVGVLLVLVATGTAAFASDRPLDLAGRGIQWLLNTTVRRRHPVVHLPQGLLADRDFIPTTPGGRWKAGVATAAANTGFDYLALLFALRAVGGQSATVTDRARLHRRRAAGAAAVHA